jgi:hypothetical protein
METSATTVSTKGHGTIAEPVMNVAAASSKALQAAERRTILTPESALSILSVRWGVTVNTGNFSSARLDAEAVVPMGGSAESTLQELREWVRSQSPLSDAEQNDAFYGRREADQQLLELQEKLVAAEAEWQKVLKVFDAVGLEIPRKYVEDLPF